MSPSLVSIAVVLMRVPGVACQAVTVALLANVLSVAQMGIFSAIYVFWGLVRMLGPLGQEQVVLRNIAYARAAEDAGLARAIAAHVIRIVLAVGVAVGVLAGAIALAVGANEGGGVSPWGILAMALAVPAFAVIGVQAAAIRAYDFNITSQTIESLGLHLLTLLCLLGHLLLAPLTLEAVLAWFCAAAWLTAAAYGAVLLLRCAGARPAAIAPVLRRTIWREGFEVWQALVLIGLASRAPTYLSFVLLGPAATAILEIAIRFGTLPTIFTSAVSMTFSPLMAGLHARGDRSGLGRVLALSSWLAFAPSLLTLVGAALLGPWLLATFFPPVYGQAFIPLLLVIASTTVNGGFGMSSTVFLMTGNQRIVRTYSALQLAAVLLFGATLALAFGVVGIAVAILVGFVVFDVGLARRVRPMLDVGGILRPSGLAELLGSFRRGGWRSAMEAGR